jgi:carbamate kinase
LEQTPQRSLVVVALGGNALLKQGQSGSFEEQYSNIKRTSEKLVDLLQLGLRVAVTHGNGPQVGATLLRHDAGAKLHHIPAFPMDACGAETQGLIGYMVQQAVQNELDRRGLRAQAVTILTRVLVDRDDPAFLNPTKPVGPFYTREEAAKLSAENPGFIYMEDSGRGWRRFVPSPDPKEILEKESIIKLLDAGNVVISTGGGGIPVIRDVEVRGVEAVIDKDLAAERLASILKADRLAILTDVDAVFVNYRRPNQMKLGRLSYEEMKEYYAQGQFSAGSMGPKVLASLRFLENGGKEAIIAHLSDLSEAIAGTRGTHIVK